MRTQKIRTILFPLLSVALISALFACDGAKKETPAAAQGVPAAGTRAKTKAGKNDVFGTTARSIRNECAQMGGCTCILDGVETTCGVVFACLEAGFCEIV